MGKYHGPTRAGATSGSPRPGGADHGFATKFTYGASHGVVTPQSCSQTRPQGLMTHMRGLQRFFAPFVAAHQT